MQFKISGQKTDAMSAGTEKIDDGEKEFGGWAGNVFLMEKMARELFAVAFWQPAGRHAAITLLCLNFAAFNPMRALRIALGSSAPWLRA